MIPARRVLFLSVVVPCLMLLGCGGAQEKRGADPIALLAEGRYAEARAIALSRGTKEPNNRAIVAISLVAEKPDASTCKKAVTALTDGINGVGAAAGAVDMLELAFHLPRPIPIEVSVALAETALGSVGQGPFAPSMVPAMSVGAASRGLAVGVLERVHLAFEESDKVLESSRLLAIWNSCFILNGGSMEALDERDAWRMFQSIGGLAIIQSKLARDSDFAIVLLTAAVSVLENNPGIAIAARCDLASPFDGLKTALAYDMKLLGKLELAVAAATGCTRGTYAPEVR